LIVLIWILKYKRALRQLLRPKFWIFFVALTMLTSFVFSQLQSKTLSEAFLIGIEMNFRATLLLLGFSVLGTELYNPKIGSFFAKTYFKKLPFALEIASESLPQVISNIPDFKIIIKNPTQIVSQLIAFAEMRFRELSEDFSKPKIFIITSKKDSGKTTFVKQIIPFFIQNNIKIGGIFTQKQIENQQRIGYDVVDIQTNNSEIFLRESGENDFEKIGKFFIFPQGVKFGKESLQKVKNTDIQLVIIDEIGRLELTGKAWANEINELLQYQNFIFLWVVRDTFLGEIIEFWKLKNYEIIDLQKISTQTANQIILNQLIGKV
jgi:nucleoside-triphosphatase